MSLFNGITTSQIIVSKTGNALDASSNVDSTQEKSDFTAAIESIGTAIGELKDELPGMLEKAFTGAIASDSTNDALYDAIASATRDSISDLHEDGIFDRKDTNKPVADNTDGRGFTKSQLLAIETVDPAEHMVDRVSDAVGKSLEKINQDRKSNELASGIGVSTERKAEQQDKILTSVSKENDTSEGKLDDAIKQGTDSITKQQPQPVAPISDTRKYVNNKVNENESVSSAKLTDNNIDMLAVSNARQGLIDTKREPNGTDISRKKMLDDVTLNLMSRTAPEFMAKGNEVFDKILNDDITTHLDQNIGDGIDLGMKGRGLGPLVKGGGMAALGAATIASLGMIGMAGKSLWDWHKANGEANKNIDSNLTNSIDTNNKMKNGVNNDLRDANIKSDKAEADLAKEKNGVLSSLADALFGTKTEEVQKKEYDAAIAEAERKIEVKRHTQMLERAEAYGIKRTDTKAVNKWLDEQKQLATKAGVNVEDKGAFIQFQNEELKRYQEAKKKALGNGTQPNGQNQNAWQSSAQPNVQQPGVQIQGQRDVAVPLAAGSNTNVTTNPVNAGTGAITDDIITAEEKARQYRQFTFEGIRDALLLPEVQAMFASMAQTAGASVEQKLMG
jgi:hypothetical protein